LEIIDPLQYPNWDDLLISTRTYSFFHSSAWARVLAESYHYEPLYLSSRDSSRFRALIPLMEVKSVFTGRRGICLPFSDFCEPIIDGSIPGEEIIQEIIGLGKARGWRFVELRGGKDLLGNAVPSSRYFGHVLDLGRSEAELRCGCRRGTKSSIRKAESNGVQVEISHSRESLKEFLRLNAMTRQRHGLPPQPSCFFEKIYDHIIAKGSGFINLATYQGKRIAGAICFHFGARGLYKYGASDMRYQHLRANNLVIWEAIRWYRQNRFECLCFGRTEPENGGLRQFKRGWGTRETEVNYYRYDLRREAFVAGHSRTTGLQNKILRRIPIHVLGRVGTILYRHAG